MEVCVMWVQNDDGYKEKVKKKKMKEEGFDCAWDRHLRLVFGRLSLSLTASFCLKFFQSFSTLPAVTAQPQHFQFCFVFVYLLVLVITPQKINSI